MALKPKTFILRSLGVIDHLAEYLRGLVSSGTVYEVVVRLHRDNRTLAQNALMWTYITFLAGEQGLTKEEVHEDLKRRLLIPIYERDDPEFFEMTQSLRNVESQGLRHDAEVLSRRIVKKTSTTDANVEQFTEYLNEIEKDSANRGISLPMPEDRYELALRGKSKP